MSWQDRLVTASWRGFDFLTDAHDTRYGQRLAVHEFPGADVPLVEDLGAKVGEWKLNAYFLGDDYDQERNRLLNLLATPGAEWLTHPWLGLLYVRAQGWSLHESSNQRGYATISIDFVAGGETPQPILDDADAASYALEEYADTVMDGFALLPLSSDAFAGLMAAASARLETMRRALSLVRLPLAYGSAIIGLIQGAKADLTELLATPARYAAWFRSLSDTIGLTTAQASETVGLANTGAARTDLPSLPQCLRLGKALSRLAVGNVQTPVITGIHAGDTAYRANRQAEQIFAAQMQAAAVCAVLLTDFDTAEQRDTALDISLAALDAILPSASDAVFQAAANLRRGMIVALLSQELQAAQARDIVRPLPAVVLAHRLDTTEAVLLARNAVRHPLFVQGRVYG